jgi:transcriptional regulator with PAS, ATPase and Fis domain
VGLENAIEHGVVFGLTDDILPEDLSGSLLGRKTPQSEVSLGYHEAVRETKRNIVRSAMERASDNYGEAAKLLGIHVNNLHWLTREWTFGIMLDSISLRSIPTRGV